MVTRLAWLVSVGVFAYFLEYIQFPFQEFVRAAVFLIGAIAVILFLLSHASPQISGRLKGSNDATDDDSQEQLHGDGIFLVSLIYAAIYLVLLRLSATGGPYRFIEWFTTLTPTNWFWLIAPIVLLRWYREFRRKRAGEAIEQ